MIRPSTATRTARVLYEKVCFALRTRKNRSALTKRYSEHCAEILLTAQALELALREETNLFAIEQIKLLNRMKWLMGAEATDAQTLTRLIGRDKEPLFITMSA